MRIRRAFGKMRGISVNLLKRVRAGVTYFRLWIFAFLMNDARFNHWPIAASNLRGSRVVCQAKFSSRDTLVCVSPTFTYTSPAILTPATEENRYVAVMFIEHDFGGFAGIKHELDCFNEPKRVNPTNEFAVRYRQRHGCYGKWKFNLQIDPVCSALRSNMSTRR